MGNLQDLEFEGFVVEFRNVLFEKEFRVRLILVFCFIYENCVIQF